MKNQTYYGTSSHKGAFQGNMVTSDIYFNRMVFRLYISRRTAQSSNVVYNSSDILKVYKEQYHNYDRYDFVIDTKSFNDLSEAWEFFCGSIISIDKSINMDYDNMNKITEELYRILG